MNKYMRERRQMTNRIMGRIKAAAVQGDKSIEARFGEISRKQMNHAVDERLIARLQKASDTTGLSQRQIVEGLLRFLPELR